MIGATSTVGVHCGLQMEGTMNVASRLLFPLALLVVSSGLFAQDAIQPYVEYRKRVEAAQNISPLEHGLFGEQVSLYNGSTTFSVTDIDLPGNNALPVRLARRLTATRPGATTQTASRSRSAPGTSAPKAPIPRKPATSTPTSSGAS